MVAGWYHAVLLAALPWCLRWDGRWVPLVVAAAALVHPTVRRSRAAEPWASAVVLLSAGIFALMGTGWRGPAWFWLATAAAVASTARFMPRGDGGRPDAADILAALCWAFPFAIAPVSFDVSNGGWLAPALMLGSARQLGAAARGGAGSRAMPLTPPQRDVRGTLSLRGVVAAEGPLPATAPIDLDLRAGESLAVLCDDYSAAQVLADVISGRRAPFAGEVLVDGAPLRVGDRLVTVIAPGEPFVAGSLIANLEALRDDPIDRSTLGAARDACGLGEVIDELGGRVLARDGEPLEPYHRLLVLAARVLVSHYRLVVAVDPGPWVDDRRTESWRAALVRASVGRTSVWITNDVELAERAGHVYEYVDGTLRRS
jgi:predicted ABC-type transport system involved in lysophospholipase L1 biosynthesis ATPase subunit